MGFFYLLLTIRQVRAHAQHDKVRAYARNTHLEEPVALLEVLVVLDYGVIGRRFNGYFVSRLQFYVAPTVQVCNIQKQ